MAKNAASEGALGELHATLAKVLTAALTSEGGAPAAVLAVAAKFLKDNDISCAVSGNSAMEELDAAMKASVAPTAPADDAALQEALNAVVDLEEYRNNGSR